jgi:hypothetical protein
MKSEKIHQPELFDKPWEEGRDYKVRSKRFIEIYDITFDHRGYQKRFVGFSEETTIKTTTGGMTLEEAENFVRFITECCNDYAGWHEIIKIENEL